MDDLIGKSLGAYSIVERIGGGGMAEVYKAMHSSLGVARALKIIRPELGSSEDFRLRFLKEAQSVAALRHQNIVQVHDFGTDQNLYYMVMEYIEGQDLKHLLRAEGRIRPIARAIGLVQQVAGALEYAHARGLIHRDIKPENIMVTRAGQPILTDFGIAKLLTANTQLTQTGMVIGTPAYMAPEQVLGSMQVGPATDVYALSVVLYELLAGRVPFTADTPIGVFGKALYEPSPDLRSVCDDVGDQLRTVVTRGIAKDVKDRYESVTVFRRALVAANEADAYPASDEYRTTIVTRSRPQAPRRSRYAAVALLGSAVATAGAYYWITTRPAGSNAGPAAAARPVPPESAPAVPAAATPVATTPVATPAVATPAVTRPAAAARAPERAPSRIPASVPPSTAVPTAEPASGSQPGTEQSLTVRNTVPPASTSLAEPARDTERAPSADDATAGSAQVQKGVTTQRDLLRLFGGPNLTTYDESGHEVWVYEQVATQTETRSSAQSTQAAASLGLFFTAVGGSAGVSRERSSEQASSASTQRSITVIVTFAPDRTVLDYTVKGTAF